MTSGGAGGTRWRRAAPRALPPRAPAILRGGLVVTVDDRRRVFAGDVLLVDGRIEQVGRRLRAPRGAEVVDCRGRIVMPGLVQAHVHLCQTLLRNRADGLGLEEWLARRVWPMEAAHDARSIALAARLGVAELLRGGTTAILDMGTSRHGEALLAAAGATGIRYLGGPALMDAGAPAAAALRRPTDESLAEAEELGRRFDGQDRGRVRFALCPRFGLTSTRALLAGVRTLSERHGWLVHTHGSETRAEVATSRRLFGLSPVEHLDRAGLLGPRTVVAHGVHLTARERRLLAGSGATVVHCPGSNLKLASGVAPLPALRDRGVALALGADGPPCNNALDGFAELKLAATLHLPRFGPAALPAAEAVALATRGGARALGLEREVGSVEEGKRADLAVLDLAAPHLAPRGDDPHALLAYAARGSDVTDVWVDGRRLLRDRRLVALDVVRLVRAAQPAARALARRAGVAR